MKKTLLFTALALATISACVAPEETNEEEQEQEVEPEPCVYPEATTLTGPGSIMPKMVWEDSAFVTIDSTRTLDLEEIYCEAEYTSIVFVMVADWCPNCPQYIAGVNRSALELRENGALVVYLDMQNNNYAPATSQEAQNYISRYLQDGVGLRVGDASSVPASVFGQAQGLWSFVPNAVVVRTSDMKVVATQETSNTILDFALITANIDAEDPTTPVIVSNCNEDDEEPFEPNDAPSQAGVLPIGSTSGGICTAAGDFYQVNVEGAWTIDLSFSNATGDLDLYVVDANGTPTLSSDSTTDDEQLVSSGPAMVLVQGYNGASAPYTITLSQ